MRASTLFSSHPIFGCVAPNRVVMAPLTRCRVTQPGDLPNELMAKYYTQRASAGFIITEGTCISPQARGHSNTPGIYTSDQVAGWREIVSSVHRRGGRIVLQLWHAGRVSHASFHEHGMPVAPSAIACEGNVWLVDETSNGRMVNCSTPRALSTSEVQDTIGDFVRAADNAISAGFDGIELHGGDGYLLDQFLRRGSNQRTDEYGGGLKDRIRFPCEVVAAVSAKIGPELVGVRISPFLTRRNMEDHEVVTATLMMARELNRIGIAYIHLAEVDGTLAPRVSETFRHELRQVFRGLVMVGGNYTAKRAHQVIADKLADFVAFGHSFVSNPDLPFRLKHDLPLNKILEPLTLLSGGERGYTDYPAYAAANWYST